MLVAESFQDTPAVYFRLSELLCWQTLLLTVRLQSCVFGSVAAKNGLFCIWETYRSFYLISDNEA